MTSLTNDQIEIMLSNLEKNQQTLRADYNERIDKLEAKVDKILEKLETLPNMYITRAEFDGFKEKLKGLEEDRKKLIRIIITAVVWAVLSLIFIK